MKVEEELAELSPEKETILTIGVFDGVHLGHRHLLSSLIEQARQRDFLSGVITFRQHPQDFFSPRNRLPFLTDLEERTGLLINEGIDFVAALSFTDELARLSASGFIGLLQKYLKMRGLVIGPDFALGRKREGDIASLRKLGQETGFSITVVPPLVVNGEVASSTSIRKALADGDAARVCKLSGRPFDLHGKVIAGAGRGAGLGFPTANMEINQEQAIPADGVYACWANIDGKAYESLANIGTCPTFNGTERTVEAYIVDYVGDLYGQELRIDFVERLRGEKKFGSVEELKKQMAEDVRKGKSILDAGSCA
ncbi:bifunctional riboflavin kinase/FAD synthetase [Chloroflexota bacterium]